MPVPSPQPPGARFAGIVAAGAVVLPTHVARPGWVEIEGGVVVAAGAGEPPTGRPLIDVGDLVCAPGFVDLHVHGGDGREVNSGTATDAEQAVRHLARFHARHGTTALLPTTVSDSPERTLASVRGAARAIGEVVGGARVLGVHLEGPWLSPNRRGAQDPDALRPFDRAELEALIDAAGGAIAIVTLAPELPGGHDAIRALREHGIVASLGHSEAGYAAAVAAFDQGARHVAHLYNAMTGLSHREPGLVGAALASDEVSVELIADGHHVHAAVLAVTFRAARRPVLVTDAIAAAGLPDGPYRLGRLDVVRRDGRVALAADERTLAGSVLTMDAAVRLLVEQAGVPLGEAIAAASANPAAVIGRDDLGRLAPGAVADLVLLDEGLRAVATVVAGRVVHDPRGALTGAAARVP